MSVKKLPSLDDMERIPHTELPEKLDEMFERIDKEDIAFIITEDGEDKYVLCPYAWFDFAQDDDFGCMVNSAIRNELNHPSENVEAVQRFITNHINSFDHRTVAVAIEDIEYASRSKLRAFENSESWMGIRNLLLTRLLEMERKQKENSNEQ